MVNWEKIKDDARNLALDAAKKAEAATDLAVFKIKISAKKSLIEEQYKQLGELVYKKIRCSGDGDERKELIKRISECVLKIDAVRGELDELLDEYKQYKSKNSRVNVSVSSSDTERDEDIMEEFDAARKEAEENYQAAIALSDDARRCAEDISDT